jgi:hypothetical protein
MRSAAPVLAALLAALAASPWAGALPVPGLPPVGPPPVALPAVVPPASCDEVLPGDARIPVPPIVLRGNDLLASPLVAGGLGTAENPFLLRDLDITAPKTLDDAFWGRAAIELTGVPHHVRLENVRIIQDPLGLSSPIFDEAITLTDSPHVHLVRVEVANVVDVVRIQGATALAVDCSRFEDFRGAGIRELGYTYGTLTIRNSTIAGLPRDPWSSHRQAGVVLIHAIRELRVEDSTVSLPGGDAIWVFRGQGDLALVVARNVLHGHAIAGNGATGRFTASVVDNTGNASIHVGGPVGAGGWVVVARNTLEGTRVGAGAGVTWSAPGVVVVEDNVVRGGGRSLWSGLHLSGGGPSTTVLRRNLVEDVGSHGIAIRESHPERGVLQVEDNTVRRARYAGLWIEPRTGTLVASNNTLEDNREGVATWSPGGMAVVLRDNAIVGNEVGARHTGPAPLDLRHNWWGSPDGPSGLGPGSGDAVVGNVLFDPWLTAPPVTSGEDF